MNNVTNALHVMCKLTFTVSYPLIRGALVSLKCFSHHVRAWWNELMGWFACAREKINMKINDRKTVGSFQDGLLRLIQHRRKMATGRHDLPLPRLLRLGWRFLLFIEVAHALGARWGMTRGLRSLVSEGGKEPVIPLRDIFFGQLPNRFFALCVL